MAQSGGNGGERPVSSPTMDFSNFVAFDEVRRREKFWDGVVKVGNLPREFSSTRTQVHCLAHATRILNENWGWRVLLIICTLIALFGPSLNYMYATARTDIYFGIFHSAIFLVFVLDFVLNIIVQPLYILTFPALLDIISSVSMVMDINMFLRHESLILQQFNTFTTMYGVRVLQQGSLPNVITFLRVVRILTFGRLLRMSQWFGGLLDYARVSQQAALVDVVLLRRLQLMFACMDEDNDGFISRDDFLQCVQYLGVGDNDDGGGAVVAGKGLVKKGSSGSGASLSISMSGHSSSALLGGGGGGSSGDLRLPKVGVAANANKGMMARHRSNISDINDDKKNKDDDENEDDNDTGQIIIPASMLQSLSFPDFKNEITFGEMGRKLREATSGSLKERSKTYNLLTYLSKRSLAQIVFGGMFILLFWSVIIQPESSIYDGGVFSGFLSLDEVDEWALKSIIADTICKDSHYTPTWPAVLYFGKVHSPSTTAIDIPPEIRSFELEYIQPPRSSPSSSDAIISVSCLLAEEYRNGLMISLVAAAFMFVASFNFLRLFDFIGAVVVTPLKAIVERMEQLAVFEYAAVGSHGVFGDSGRKREDDDEQDGVKTRNNKRRKEEEIGGFVSVFMNVLLNIFSFSRAALGEKTEESDSAAGAVVEMKELNKALDRVQSMISSWAKYCPYDVVQMVMRTGEEVSLGVAPREVTVFFSDIESFTTICEQLQPNTVLKLLSEYFSTVSEVITDHQGTLLEFIGDGIMAVWNAPATVKFHSERALHAALSMQQAVAEKSQSDEMWISALGKVGKTKLRVRMGLHAGRVLAGNVGAPNRMKYGLLGDVVNTSSRLEELNKRFGTNIIISEDVYKQPLVKTNFVARILDRVAVKGRESGLTVFEVLCLTDGSDEFQRILANLHDEAFNKYVGGHFVEAAKLLRRAEEVSQVAGISVEASSVLRRQAIQYAKNPPPLGPDGKMSWDGTTHLDSKDGTATKPPPTSH